MNLLSLIGLWERWELGITWKTYCYSEYPEWQGLRLRILWCLAWRSTQWIAPLSLFGTSLEKASHSNLLAWLQITTPWWSQQVNKGWGNSTTSQFEPFLHTSLAGTRQSFTRRQRCLGVYFIHRHLAIQWSGLEWMPAFIIFIHFTLSC